MKFVEPRPPNAPDRPVQPLSEVKSFPEAAEYLRRITETRANEYGAEDTADECRVLFTAARMLEGDVDALRALLPSWRWPEFGVDLDVRTFPERAREILESDDS